MTIYICHKKIFASTEYQFLWQYLLSQKIYISDKWGDGDGGWERCAIASAL